MKKIDNFKKAFENLKDIYDYEEPYNNVEMAGLVGLFEICFEQSWKAIREYLIDQGYKEGSTGSPKQILKTAYEYGLIEDEAGWLKALSDRNNVAHAYNEDIALEIINDTREYHYQLFEKLKSELTE